MAITHLDFFYQLLYFKMVIASLFLLCDFVVALIYLHVLKKHSLTKLDKGLFCNISFLRMLHQIFIYTIIAHHKIP